jgi:hypothetical protein
MKARVALLLAIALAAVLLGCPLYSSDGLSRVCDPTGCYDCPGGFLSPDCAPVACTRGAMCAYGCSAASPCAAGSICGQDGACHVGDCSVWGCPAGSECRVAGGVASCVAGIATTPDASTDGAGPEGAAAEAAAPEAAPPDAASPDAADGAVLDASGGD